MGEVLEYLMYVIVRYQYIRSSTISQFQVKTAEVLNIFNRRYKVFDISSDSCRAADDSEKRCSAAELSRHQSRPLESRRDTNVVRMQSRCLWTADVRRWMSRFMRLGTGETFDKFCLQTMKM